MNDFSSRPEDTSGMPEDNAGAAKSGAQPSGPSVPSFGRSLRTPFAPERLASPMLRCVLIGVITLVLLMPLGLVDNSVSERSWLQQEAMRNITGSWGGPQTISGPILVVPYEVIVERKETVKVKLEGNKEETREVVHRDTSLRHKIILPAELNFGVRLDPEVRYRGIYRQALYNAPVSVHGSFKLPEAAEFGRNLYRIYWKHAWLAMGVTDLKTISEDKPLQWGGVTASSYKPGAMAGDVLGSGFHTNVPLVEEDAGERRDFSLELKIRGSGGLGFTPVGEKTNINVAGTWPDPSFKGNLLPVTRTITEQGFSAEWRISNLTRSYPQIGDLESKTFGGDTVTSFTAGVDLHEGVSLYRVLRRALHYGILFISVTFVALFAFEMISRQRMHLLQYGMVGLSMCVFYLILLSLSEHISFALAFSAAGAVIVAMNSLYVAAALHSRRRGLAMGGLLAGLYGLLFCLLRMEDFALIVGTGMVVAMMGVLMFVTRKLPTSS